ncbi:MAG TPA: SPFH domain-containing protein [Verrucomicrobiota bacterium]|nr:SPFH domain-containing protein [Verrucomicrobiota bacterium]
MNQTPPLPPVPPSPPQPSETGPPERSPSTFEDASSTALSEALRSSFRILKVLMLGLVLLFLCSGMFVVEPNEVVVKLLFGKPVGVGKDQLLQPGWHWAWPYPINEKVRIRVGQSQTATSTAGWHATTPEMEAMNEEPMAYGYLRPEADGYTLAADGNIIHVRASVKYRITDPLQYAFGFAHVERILTNIVNNAIIYASARYTAEAALYRDKLAFRDTVIQRVAQLTEAANLGITLEPSDVETKTPIDVRGAFEDVNKAEQIRSTEISKALSYRDELVNRTLGQSNAIVNAGLVSSNQMVAAVAATAQVFKDQLPSYRADPHLFKERLLATRLQRVLTNANVKFTLPEGFQELRLQLSREPEKAQTTSTP